MIGSSYEFHRELESPAGFFRREWQTLAVFGGGFLAVLVVGIFAAGPAYFYPRITTDALNYYLKGVTLVETGTTAARHAVNEQPFPYLSTPGVLRAPFIAAFRNFDTQLRAIQIANVVLVGAIAAMYSYVLSWAVPRRWHWLAIGYAFAFMLLNPDWGANVFGVLADAPYAAAAIAYIIVSTRILTSDRPLSSRIPAMLACTALFAVAFLTRFTAPVLFVHTAFLAWGRWGRERAGRKRIAAAVVVAFLMIALLTVLNWDTLSTRYLMEPFRFVQHVPKSMMSMNLFAMALPSQIIPDYQLGFTGYVVVDPFHIRFGSTRREVVLIWLGFLISATTLLGMWRSRRRFAPEIAYVVAAAPVLAAVIPSTARYLIAYQPFFWIFFYRGASVFFQPVAARVAATPRAAAVGVLLLLGAGTGALLLRSRVAHPADAQGATISIGETRAYSSEVSSTYAALRAFIETLPRSRTLLVGWPASVGRWRVISGYDYYQPDSAFSMAAATHDIYLVLDCSTLRMCHSFDYLDRRVRQRFVKLGRFSFDEVFSRSTPHARAKVYRIRDIP